MPGPFSGKYRGVVVDQRDPLRQGRLQVAVPEVLGQERMSWAMPCVPFAGPGIGLLALPPVGGHIWVEFEAGDPDYPIWVGCFWAPGELPTQLPAQGASVLRVGDVALVANDIGRGEPVMPAVLPIAASARAATEVTISGSGFVLSRGGRAIVTVDDDQVALTLGTLQVRLSQRDNTVTVNQAESTVTVSADSIELSSTAHTTRVSTNGIELKSGAASVNLTPAKVELAHGDATASLTPGLVKLANGAASVALNPVSVTVNDGAMEVI